MKVLVYTSAGRLRLPDPSKERIRKKVEKAGFEVVFVDEHEQAIRQIEQAEILFGYITPEMLNKGIRLQWIQAPMASLGYPSGDYYIFPELMDSQVTLTNMSGIYSDIISTHVFAYITCFARDFTKLISNQGKRIWNREINPINLNGKCLCVVGLGGIGKAVARISAAFGMRVIAIEPHPDDVPPCVEGIWPPKYLKKMISESDFIVLCLPDAPGTVNMIGAEEIKAMKKNAYLINIGRGRNVDLEALTQALKDGHLAGAGLDVFPPDLEPLPADHPLWKMDNVIITPHCAGYKTPPTRRVDVFLENFTRYINGEELLNLTDKKKMIRLGREYILPT